MAKGGQVMLGIFDLDALDRNYARRCYRILRIRVPYGAPGSPELNGSRAEGCSYGMSRQEAKDFIYDFFSEVSWRAYLGSK